MSWDPCARVAGKGKFHLPVRGTFKNRNKKEKGNLGLIDVLMSRKEGGHFDKGEPTVGLSKNMTGQRGQ